MHHIIASKAPVGEDYSLRHLQNRGKRKKMQLGETTVGGLRRTAVKLPSLTGELSVPCARPAADG